MLDFPRAPIGRGRHGAIEMIEATLLGYNSGFVGVPGINAAFRANVYQDFV
jgi:hypothetical protein